MSWIVVNKILIFYLFKCRDINFKTFASCTSKYYLLNVDKINDNLNEK